MPRKRDPLRKSIEVLYSVRLIKDRISMLQSRVEERTKELTKRLVDLQTRGENYLAKKYAEEISKLRQLSNRLSTLLLVVDKVDLALQRAIVLREYTVISSELRDLLKDISKLPEFKLPDLSLLFAELEESVRELWDMSVVGGGEVLSYNPPSDSEVKAIMEEAKAILREKLEPAH